MVGLPANERSKIENIKKLLESMSPDARSEVRSYISLLGSKKPDRKREGLSLSQSQTRDESMWLDSLAEQLARKAGSPVSTFRTLQSHSELTRKSYAIVEEFIKRHNLYKPESYVRKKVYDVLATLLAEHVIDLARHVNAPLGIKYAMEHTNQIAQLFDLAYPGYLYSGLACMIISQFNQNEGALDVRNKPSSQAGSDS